MTADKGYALVTSAKYQDNNSNILLYRFNSFGDTLWTKEFGDTAFQSGWKCKQTRDKGFIITGQTATYDYFGDVLLIKTDSNGVIQWEKHFGGTNSDIAFDIDTCFDGGFILSGSTLSYGQNTQFYFPNIYIVKTDSMGNLLWDKTLGGDYDDRMTSILQSKDGNYIAAGFTSSYDPHEYCCGGWQYPTMLKLDTSGNLIWERHYGNAIENTYLFSLIEDNDTNLLASGTVRDTIVYSNRGLLIKANKNGDSLWYRSYAALASKTESFFYSATSDNDNGCIAIGYLYPVPPDTGDQDIWIVKTDSNGCEYLNCLSLIGVNEVSESAEIKLFPNPSNGILNLYIEDVVKEKGLEAIISDIAGRKINVFSLNDKTDTIDCKNLKQGIYFLTIYFKNGAQKTIRFEKI